MKSLFAHTFITQGIFEMIQNWPIGTIAGIVVSIFLLIVCALIIYTAKILLVDGLFCLMDSCFLTTQKTMGRLTGKQFIPAHTKDVYDHKSEKFYTINVPDSWKARIKIIDGREKSISVGKDLYKSVPEGRAVIVNYSNGRFSKRLYLKEVFKM
jgi:hypothetical protein